MKIDAVTATIGALFVAIVTTGVNHTVTKYLDRPATVSAEIDMVPFVNPVPVRETGRQGMIDDLDQIVSKLDPKVDRSFLKPIAERALQIDRAQSAADAKCSHFIRLTNNTSRPIKDIKITGENITGFSAIEEAKFGSGKVIETRAEKSFTIDSFEPDARKTIVAFSTTDCANEYGWHDKLRIYNSDSSASIRITSLPRGLLVFLNDYWYATFTLTAIGGLVVCIILLSAIIELLTKLQIIDPRAKPNITNGAQKESGNTTIPPTSSPS